MGKPDNRRDILLAEDDLDDVEIFEMALNDLALSYEIRHAKNGDQLLELLRERVPYILFLDIRRSEEHTSELQSLMRISYAVFCLNKKKHNTHTELTLYII